jgi:hypothetical protein
MYCANLELSKLVEDARRADERRQAEHWRLLRRVRGDHRGWLSKQGCWLLCQLGRMLVRVGRRLERYGAPQPAWGNG